MVSQRTARYLSAVDPNWIPLDFGYLGSPTKEMATGALFGLIRNNGSKVAKGKIAPAGSSVRQEGRRVIRNWPGAAPLLGNRALRFT
jgi:hypothetical protein